MSKDDMRAIVDVKIDFITQNVLLGSTYNCHQNDEWKDPREGTQDCLMDRIHLCGNEGPNVNWDFTSCLYTNQFVTTKKTDNMRGFNKTVEYCQDLWGLGNAPTECAYSDKGAKLLQASHAREVALNPSKDPNINWIVVNGKNYANDESANWLQIVCDAYTGSPKPASCSPSVTWETLSFTKSEPRMLQV